MIINIKSTIKKSSVLRFLGYKEISKVPDIIFTKVDSVIDKVSNVSGKIIYDEFKFIVDKKTKKVIIGDVYSFSGDEIFKSLPSCKSLLIAISTLEKDFEKKYKEIAMDGTIYEMIIDAVGTTAINDINHKFWLKIKDNYENKGFSLTERFAPGDNYWDLSNQKTIFSLLNGSKIGVKLNEKYVMEPEKSLTMVYGIKQGKYSPSQEHSCDKCSFNHLQLSK